MKYTRYSRYTGESLDWLDLEQLVGRLSDFLLQSGFENQYYGVYEMDPSHTMVQLREAVLRPLLEGDIVPPDMLEQLRFGARDTAGSRERPCSPGAGTRSRR